MGIFFSSAPQKEEEKKFYTAAKTGNIKQFYESLSAEHKLDSFWKERPACSNYLIENSVDTYNVEIIGKIINIYNNFYTSETPIIKHIQVINLNSDCKIGFTDEQWKYMNKFLPKKDENKNE